MQAFIALKRHLTIQCILLATILPLDGYAASRTNILEDASGAITSGDCDLAASLFEKIHENTMGAMAHYSLAVCYSKVRNTYRTFSQAVDALCGTPALEGRYANGAKELVRWAGTELARPKLRPISEDEPPDTNVASVTAKIEAAKKQAATIEALKSRVKPYIDVDMEIVKAKLTDTCWDESNLNLPVDCALTDSHRPPDVPSAP